MCPTPIIIIPIIIQAEQVTWLIVWISLPLSPLLQPEEFAGGADPADDARPSYNR